MLDLGRLDPYVQWVLQKNGWTPGREFPLAEAHIAEITALGFPAVDYGVRVLRSLGALRFREHYPESYRRLVRSWREQGLPPERWPEAAEIREGCQAALTALEELGLEAAGYKGATFTFDALEAARDVEIVLDLDTVRQVVGGPVFPIGTVEPDGIVFAAADGGVYVVFDDSIFAAGRCVEEFLQVLLVRGCDPLEIYHGD